MKLYFDFTDLVDINECNGSVAVCDINADCIDLNGTFECTCQQGFSGDGVNCSGKILYQFRCTSTIVIVVRR